MKKKNEEGFSLIELLTVFVVIGIIAAMAVPALQKSLLAAENGKTFSSMRTIASTQVAFYSQNSRFGRLNEINSQMSQSLGTVAGNQLIQNKYVYEMAPASPTDAELKQSYTITATRNLAGEGQIFKFEVTQAGDINQILP